MFVHGRILRPFLGLNLLFMSLPLVLGGYGPEHVHQPGLCAREFGDLLRSDPLLSVSGHASGISRRSCQPGCRSDRFWSDRRLALGSDSDLTIARAWCRRGGLLDPVRRTALHSRDIFQSSQRLRITAIARPA